MSRSTLAAAVGVLFTLLSARPPAAQTLAGTWDGHVQLPSGRLELTATFETDGGGYTGTVDIPSQGARGLALQGVSAEGAAVTFQISGVPGSPTFTGTVDGDAMTGAFTQARLETTFTLARRTARAPEPAPVEREPTAERERPRAGSARPSVSRAVDSVRAVVPRMMEALDVPGVAVAVVTRDGVQMAEGFGYRDVEAGLPVTARTLFPIGSATKPFTATALGTQVDAGRIGWDTPVREALPAFDLRDAVAAREATPRDLLTHRLGLPRHDFVWYGADLTREEAVRRLRYLEPTAPFRTAWQYQNLAFVAAGALAGHLAGTTWEGLVEGEILGPLGMTSTVFTVEAMEQAPDHASGYESGGGADASERLPYYRKTEGIGPAGNIVSNVEDMARWVQMNLGGGALDGSGVVSPGVLAEIHRPQILRDAPASGPTSVRMYGLGWFVDVYRGELLTYHGGNIDGFSAVVGFLPRHDLGVVVLTNKDATRLPALVLRAAVDAALGLEPTPWAVPADGGGPAEDEAERVAGTSPSHPLEAYAQTYVHPAYGQLVVDLRDGGLHLRLNGIESPLEHVHYDVFRGEDRRAGGVRVQFTTDINGAVDAAAVPLEPSLPPLVFTREADARLRDPSFLQRYVGEYQVAQGPRFRVFVEGSGLKMQIEGRPTRDLEPVSETTFEVAELPGNAVQFSLDRGAVVGAALQFSGRSLPAEKVE